MLENPLLTNKTSIKSKVLGQDVLNLLDKTFVIPEDFSYNVIEVSSEYVARMDIISMQFYGTEKYQDVLCKLNGISNPFELNEGTVIVIPDVGSISDFYYKESESELDPSSTNSSYIPQAKQKTEKRKPNEAVVGDKRFKIDPTRKVIIY